MSRKDYVEAARIIPETAMSSETRAALVARFVTMFADENPRFSPSRFRDACEPAPDVVEQAEQEGYERGKAAGSWLLDGNSTEQAARRLLQGIEDGDPEVLDELPSAPLSGEWADDPLPRDVLGALGVDEDDDGAEDVLRAYEDGFSRGVTDEACRSAVRCWRRREALRALRRATKSRSRHARSRLAAAATSHRLGVGRD
jgi:hypothetical protein